MTSRGAICFRWEHGKSICGHTQEKDADEWEGVGESHLRTFIFSIWKARSSIKNELIGGDVKDVMKKEKFHNTDLIM